MTAKIVSQKRWSKLVASTGPLAQPPGALSRASNLLFTTRGSLQIANGSAPIGQIPSPYTSPEFIAAFTLYASGQYPLYPVLAATSAPTLTAPANFTAAANVGASTNPPGTYIFCVIANGSVTGAHSDPALAVYTLVAGSAFPGVTFAWNAVANAASYSVYYLATGLGSTVGQEVVTNTTSLTAIFTGALISGSNNVPQGNTSTLLQLFIGSVTSPNKTVVFSPVTNGVWPASPTLPAQVAPGDPNFVFDPISTTPQTFTPTTYAGSGSASANVSHPSVTDNFVISGFSSYSIIADQTVTFYVTCSGSFNVNGGLYSFVYFNLSFDGGSTWNNYMTQPTGGGETFSGTFSFSLSTSLLTDLSDLKLQVSCQATYAGGGPSGDSTAQCTVTNAYVTTVSYSSFSPYGGIAGVACPIPMELQFDNQEILILGNGLAPMACNPLLLAGAAPAALTNSFQAAYPTWQASVDWTAGAQITDGSGNYYTATQEGVSGLTAPAWNTAKGAETSDGSVIWTSQGAIVASVAPRGAAHAVAYAGSLWLANTAPATTSDGIDGPTCLKMSDSNNPNSWNPVNTAFIGRDDGTQITGLQPFTIAALGISPTGSLCVFKEFQTYQVIGVFGSTSFEIQPAQTNLGCIAARSIQFLPGFGVCRFSHLGFAVFDGINDRLISEDIRPYLFGGVDSESDLTPVDPTYVYLAQSAQTVTPPMYFCAMPLSGNSGALTCLFCYDLVMKAWAVLDLPWAIRSLGTISTGEGYPLVLAGKTDGTIQRMQSGDLNWDQGDANQSAVAWSFRSPDLFGEGGSQRLFFEQATIRGYGSAAMVQSILAKLWLDGQQLGAQGVDVVPQGGSSLFETKVAIFRNGYRAHLDVSGNSGGAAGTIDSIDWAVTPKSSLARRIIS